MAVLAAELGIEVVGYQTGLYGPALVTGTDDAVALLQTLGPGDAVLVKGSRVARLEDGRDRVRCGALSRRRPARSQSHARRRSRHRRRPAG